MIGEYKKLDRRLNDTLENFRLEVQFDVETFEQTHKDEYLTKNDLEELGRQIYYCLSDMRNALLDYLKTDLRQR